MGLKERVVILGLTAMLASSPQPQAADIVSFQPLAQTAECATDRVEAAKSIVNGKLDIGFSVPVGVTPNQELGYDFNKQRIGSGFLLKKDGNYYAVSVYHVVGFIGGVGRHVYGQEVKDIQVTISFPGIDSDEKMTVPFSQFKGNVNKLVSIDPFAEKGNQFKADGIVAAKIDLNNPEYQTIKDLLDSKQITPLVLAPEGYQPSEIYAVSNQEGDNYQIAKATHGNTKNGLYDLIQAEQDPDKKNPNRIKAGSSGGAFLDTKCVPEEGTVVTNVVVGLDAIRDGLNPVGLVGNIFGQILDDKNMLEESAKLTKDTISFIPITAEDILD